jgi:DNA-binding XRE family transcriptional regulator
VEKKPAQIAHKTALRYSYPPYYVGLVDGKLPVFNVPGECWKDLERGLAPAAGEARQTLLGLRSELRWPRSALAAFMGVSRDVVRRWETGERNPSGAARRLIWLLDLLARRPEKLKSGLDLIFWGKGAEIRQFARKLMH